MDPTTPYIGRLAEARTGWVSKARCRSTDPDELFVRGAAQRKATVICRHCLVVAECLAYALGNQMEFGVWGGMTERQRRVLLKQHPEVAKFFAAQRWQTGVDQRTGRLIVRHGRPSGAEAMANSVDANERRTSSTGTRPSPTCSTSSTTSTKGVGERTAMDPKPEVCKHVYVVDSTGPRVVLRCMHCQKVMQ
jgi:WhiB family transcriptional regulator, redox-sensing transcriptional regulator